MNKKRKDPSATFAIIGFLAMIAIGISYCTRSAEEIARDSARYIDCKKNHSANYCECLVIGAKKKVDWSDWVAWLDGASPINTDTRSAITKLTYNCQGL